MDGPFRTREQRALLSSGLWTSRFPPVGFWDFIAPDEESFLEAAREFLPAAVAIGPVVLSQDELAQLAYLNPAGGLGLATRLYWSARELGVPRLQADALWTQVNEQAAARGFGEGPGGGSSFGWEAIKIMPTLIIPDAFRVAVEASSGGRPIVNVVGVVNAGGTAAGAAAAVQTAWKVAGGPLSRLGAHYALTGFRATDLSSATGEVALVGDSAAGSQGTGHKATNGAAALVKVSGGTRSRSSNGRMYWGPLLETDVDADGRTMDAAARTALQTAFTNFQTSLTSSGYVWSVLSPTLSIATPVTSIAVQPVIATQRRRIRG